MCQINFELFELISCLFWKTDSKIWKGNKKLNKIIWREKYYLALSENLTLKDIMKLRDCSNKTAVEIREKAFEYCANKDMYFDKRHIPTNAVLEVTGIDIQYYYEKMIKEKSYFECCEA